MDQREPALSAFLLEMSQAMVEWYHRNGGTYPMSLNIKNEETHKLAKELADLTGESMSEAVAQAVRQRLQRVRSERGEGLVERLLAIGRDCAAHMKEPYLSIDHADLLYDELGLPK
jgi:antitoxin VapB